MKKLITISLSLVLMATTLTSCYVNKFNIGAGAPIKSVKVKKWNHYLIDGLIPIGTADPQVMAGGAKDYSVTIKHSFVNLLVGMITGGIYTPTVTLIRK